MKTLILTTITILVLSMSAMAQVNSRIVKEFPCHDWHSNIYQSKIKTIDSLKKIGYQLTGFRVDNTIKQKGYNTQVLTFIKSK